jgi:bromodomain-containing protein 8
VLAARVSDYAVRLTDLLLQSDAPGYSKIVKQPMDLKRIKTKIRKGEILSIDEFQRDLLLIFWYVLLGNTLDLANSCSPSHSNAMLYNRPNSEVYRMAQEMMVWCEQKINDYRNLQHHIRQNS